MKKLLILLFSVLLSFNSYGEWTKIIDSIEGDYFYVDKETIKQHGGFVYYWTLTDYLEPSPSGVMSVKKYAKVDCGVNRMTYLTYIFYKQSMGNGNGVTDDGADPWKYPDPNSVGGFKLRFICDYIK